MSVLSLYTPRYTPIRRIEGFLVKFSLMGDKSLHARLKGRKSDIPLMSPKSPIPDKPLIPLMSDICLISPPADMSDLYLISPLYLISRYAALKPYVIACRR